MKIKNYIKLLKKNIYVTESLEINLLRVILILIIIDFIYLINLFFVRLLIKFTTILTYNNKNNKTVKYKLILILQFYFHNCE